MNRLTLCLLLSFSLTCTWVWAQKKSQPLDILITNARIIDGSGNPWFNGEVGIKDGQIVLVGDAKGMKANQKIDAKGKIVAPGFIDVHAHVEGSIQARPVAENFLYDGVTSIITGNCGNSSEDLDDFFRELTKSGISVNVASLVGHNTVRGEVMGTVNRAPSDKEQKKMEKLGEKAMEDGAVGLSTGLIYIPGTFAKTEEVVGLARVVKEYNGVYASHIRKEDHEVLDAIDEAVNIGREADIPVQISHFKISGKTSWGKSVETIARVEKYREEGIDVTVDQYPYTASSTRLSVLVPSWAQSGGSDSFNIRLNDAETRSQIENDMKIMLDETGFSDFSYGFIANCPWNKEYNGKNISEVNVMMGKEKNVEQEIQTIIDLVKVGRRVQMVYHKMGEEDVQRIMQYPLSMVARDAGIPEFGTSSPHPRTYGSCGRVLGHYVRELNVIRLEDAIRKMTSLPAQRFQFTDRGLIQTGKVADLVIFDPNEIRSEATFEKPHSYTKGMSYVLVNGVIVIEEGKHNGRKPGVIIKGQGGTD
ncbi:MAG: D-aminoacylase [Bacteroidia bacterium]